MNSNHIIIKIDHATGMRKGVSRGSEMRGKEKIYDPWLRIPINEVTNIAKKMTLKYPNDIDSLIRDINTSGASHINRVFFDKIWKKLKDSDKFAKQIIKHCTPQVNVLFIQFYAHRLFEAGRLEESYQLLQQSVDLAKTFDDISWDKWVVSGHFFNARYHKSTEDKAKFCTNVLLDPRTLNYSPHLKYWKIFRSAAWLVGHNIKTDDAIRGIERYKELNFGGYTELRGMDKAVWTTNGILESYEKCLNLMTDTLAHHLGNP